MRNLILLLGLLPFVSSCSSVCKEHSRPQASIYNLEPGEYQILFTASEGSRVGRQARGHLWLIRDENHWSDSKLYGRIQADFTRVGAPVYPGEEPDPDSSDPDSPGVVVHTLNFKSDYPPDTPILTIGTVSNTNPVVGHTPEGVKIIRITTDGPGIGLWVHRISDGGFVGRWSEWGILVDGRGTFCARKVQTSG